MSEWNKRILEVVLIIHRVTTHISSSAVLCTSNPTWSIETPHLHQALKKLGKICPANLSRIFDLRNRLLKTYVAKEQTNLRAKISRSDNTVSLLQEPLSAFLLHSSANQRQLLCLTKTNNKKRSLQLILKGNLLAR